MPPWVLSGLLLARQRCVNLGFAPRTLHGAACSRSQENPSDDHCQRASSSGDGHSRFEAAVQKRGRLLRGAGCQWEGRAHLILELDSLGSRLSRLGISARKPMAGTNAT